MATYFRIAGVAYLLLDKNDPDTKPELQAKLRDAFPVAFENTNIAVLSVEKSLGFGFTARDFLQTDSDAPETAIATIGGAEHNLAMIQIDGLPADEPGLQGRIENGRIAPTEGKVLEEGEKFSMVERVAGSTFQKVEFFPARQNGWLIFNEAWHPDWRAFEGGQEIPIHRAMLAFSAVQTSGKEAVVFKFREPWWYGVCIWTGLSGWAAVLALLLFSLANQRAFPLQKSSGSESAES
jgi:hypothetical protein